MRRRFQAHHWKTCPLETCAHKNLHNCNINHPPHKLNSQLKMRRKTLKMVATIKGELKKNKTRMMKMKYHHPQAKRHTQESATLFKETIWWTWS
jgi:hypothetical protein